MRKTIQVQNNHYNINLQKGMNAKSYSQIMHNQLRHIRLRVRFLRKYAL